MERTTVIIVEDIDEIRESLAARIDAEDLLICMATYKDAEDALANIPSKKPDIVLMDIGLPYMSGIECMLRIKVRHPDIRFLMFTIFDHDDKVFDALKAGASGYILKEDGSKGAVQAVYDLLDGGAPMSTPIAQKVLRSFHRYQPKDKTVERLTPRQVEILQLLSEGLYYKEIAQRLTPAITIGGLKQSINRIYRKLQVNNKTEAINKWLGT